MRVLLPAPEGALMTSIMPGLLIAVSRGEALADGFRLDGGKEMNGQFFWLSLKQHLEDTKNIAGLLWEHWLCEGQRKLIEESLDDSSEDKGKKLAMFLGAIHDIGKATPAFQTKKGYEYSA